MGGKNSTCAASDESKVTTVMIAIILLVLLLVSKIIRLPSQKAGDLWKHDDGATKKNLTLNLLDVTNNEADFLVLIFCVLQISSLLLASSYRNVNALITFRELLVR